MGKNKQAQRTKNNARVNINYMQSRDYKLHAE